MRNMSSTGSDEIDMLLRNVIRIERELEEAKKYLNMLQSKHDDAVIRARSRTEIGKMYYLRCDGATYRAQNHLAIGSPGKMSIERVYL